MNKYTVCIVGAGSIGALKPDHIDFPGSTNILTHCHSVYLHPRTQLAVIMDNDLTAAIKAENKWGPAKVYPDVASMYEKESPDIAICAVPTEHHYSIMMKLLTTPCDSPRLIIAEKLFCRNLIEAKIIKKESKLRDIPIAINYTRRFAKGYRDFKTLIESGKLGTAMNARVLYCRGLKHEGCHAIDLMRYFFGECVDQYVELRDIGVGPERYIVDRDVNDCSVYANFEFENCPNVVFQPCDGRKYGIFEIDICFENGRYRFVDNGLFVERYPILEENEWGHKSLNYRLTSVIRQETGLNTALYCLIDNAVNFLDGNADLLCTADDAIEVHKILEGVR